MLRVFGTFGLGILFLIISPPLRNSLVADFTAFGNTMDQHSPLSYVGMGVLVLLAVMFGLYRAAQPR